MYERRKITKQEERDICTGMIASVEFMQRLRPIYRPELFSLVYARTVAEWCAQYYDKYQKVPFRDIKSVFEVGADNLRDSEQVDLISDFLDNLSLAFSDPGYEFNIEFELDKAIIYFKTRAIDLHCERVNAFKNIGDLTRAEAEIAGFKRVEKTLGQGLNLFSDIGAVTNATRTQDSDVMFTWPGDVGKLIRPIVRDDFFVILGPAKRSKSIFLQECGLMAVFNKKNVLYVSLEMPQSQMQIRLYQRLCAEIRPSQKEEGGLQTIEIPEFDSSYETNRVINFKKTEKSGINTSVVIQKLQNMQTFLKDKQFKLVCFPSGSFNVRSGLVPLLDNLEHYEGFVPDLICADYPDIFAAESKTNDPRQQINDTWLALRGLGQERKVAIAVVSHTNKATFDRDIRQSDMSEDNRKLNHVTLAVSLNQTEEDQERKVIRLGVIADRLDGFVKNKEVEVVQCLDIMRPILDSRLLDKE
jgi:hypothetical protein